MFSGDSSGEGLMNHFAQYQIHAAASGGAGIDWATLAQQWIQMKDCMPIAANATQHMVDYTYNGLPPPPPLPNYNHYQTSTASAFKVDEVTNMKIEEKGEADMDMDDDEDNVIDNSSNNKKEICALPTIPHVSSNIQINNGSQNNWYSQNVGLRSGVEPLKKNNLLSSHQNSVSNWNNWQVGNNAANPSQMPQRIANSTSHIPSLLNLNVINPNDFNDGFDSKMSNETSNSGVDAAKRKILPAWIREGLEKMEREKQKQLEREKLEKEEQLKNRWDSDGDADEIVVNENLLLQKNANLVNNLNCNEEVYSSGNEEDKQAITNKRNLAADESDSELNDQRLNSQASSKLNKKHYKTFEEKLNNLMVAVRRNLTELLLEVTNKEIATIVHETIRAQRLKASSAQVIRKSAISSITGKLGLAAYEDSSDSDSDNTQNDSDHEKKSSNYDSEEELKQTIRSRRRAFAKVAEDIERRVAAAADKEDHKLKYYKQLEKERGLGDDRPKYNCGNAEKVRNSLNNYGTKHDSEVTKYGKFGKTFSKGFGEASVSKLHYINGKQHSNNRKERTSRFSDNKDSKSVTAAAAAAAVAVAASTFSSSCNKSNQKSQAMPNPRTSLLQNSHSNNESSNDIELLNQLSKSKNSGGIHNMLSAADKAIEKASKKLSSPTEKKRRRSRSFSTDEDRKSRKRYHHKRHRSVSSSSSSSSESENDSSKSSESSETSSKQSRSSSDSFKRRGKERHRSTSSSHRYDRSKRKEYRYSSSSKRSKEYKNDNYDRKSKRRRNYSTDSENDDSEYYRDQKARRSSKRYTSSKYYSKRYPSRSSSRSRSRSKSRTRSRSSKKKSRSISRSRSHSYSSSIKHRRRH